MELYKNDAETNILRAYLECALWSSTDDTDEPLDDNFTIEDISEESLDIAKKDIDRFIEMVDFYNLDINTSTIDHNFQLIRNLNSSTIGHDFWLTRNGHGVGFWDGDYPKEIEDVLMEAVKHFPEVWLYLGDDKQLHFI